MNEKIKTELLSRLRCPACDGAYTTVKAQNLICSRCGKKVRLINGKPVFTPVPPGMQAAPKIIRGPDEGSPWRRANWKFLESVIQSLPLEAIVLDFGAGHGDFSEILNSHVHIALDVFPYDEVDLVCDLGKIVPFKKKSFDAIILMNVLEHIPQPQNLMKTLTGLLRPSGKLIISVPFLLKLHQQPYDFFRYSHYQLENLGREAGLDMLKIEGYYDPILFFKESVHNIQCYVLPGLPLILRKTSRVILGVISAFVSVIKYLIGSGYVRNPEDDKSPYPIGYHVIYQPKEEIQKQKSKKQ